MKINYKYGKLTDGVLGYAPNRLIVNDKQIFNATEKEYKAVGYYPIVKTEPPQNTGKYYTNSYIFTGEDIKEIWQETEIPDEATETDYINALEELGVDFNE